MTIIVTPLYYPSPFPILCVMKHKESMEFYNAASEPKIMKWYETDHKLTRKRERIS
jgi:hypothetical protein